MPTTKDFRPSPEEAQAFADQLLPAVRDRLARAADSGQAIDCRLEQGEWEVPQYITGSSQFTEIRPDGSFRLVLEIRPLTSQQLEERELERRAARAGAA